MSKQIINNPIVLTEAQFKARESAGTLANGVYQIIQEVNIPATPTSEGDVGDFAWDTNYFYVCTSKNTWKRIPCDSWSE